MPHARSHLAALLSSAALLALASGVAPAADPDPAELLKLAPRLSHTDADLQKVDLAVSFTMPTYGINFKLRLLATSRDKAAVYIVDPVDNTPVMASADGVTLIYDPQSSSVMYVHDTRPSFDLLYQNGAVRWNFGFTQADGAPAAPGVAAAWKLQVDAASFIDAATLSRSLKPLDGGATEFTGLTDKNARVTARLAPHRSAPLVGLQFTPPAGRGVGVSIDSLQLNGDVGETIRALPTAHALQEEFPNVIDLDWTSAENANERERKRTLVLERLFKALIFRNAISHVELRPSAEQAFGNIDWTAYEKRDKLNADKLRKIITVPGVQAPG
jgi:hypothetical protein